MERQRRQELADRRIEPIVAELRLEFARQEREELLEYLAQSQPPSIESEETNPMRALVQEHYLPAGLQDSQDSEMVLQRVCDEFHLTAENLFAKNREIAVARARHVLMFLLYVDTKLSYPDIGSMLGGRDHTTVMHGVAKIETAITEDRQLEEQVKRIRSKYKN